MSRVEPLFTLREISELIDGELIFPQRRSDAARSHDREILSVTIDSREAAAGAFFVPLPGTHADGHDYIEDAAKRGASATFVSEQVFASRRVELNHLIGVHEIALFVVRDVLTALQDLSRYYLGKVPDLYRIGITGSNGKTTTKEMIASILQQVGATYFSAGNFNSEIGLPLSVLTLHPSHRYGVFEMAMNHRGEMQVLADILRPDSALITNIGVAHVGLVGSRDAIAEEKKKIFSRFNGNQDAFVPEDDDFADFLSRGVNGRIHLYGTRSTEGFAAAVGRGLDGTTLRWADHEIALPLPGAHNVRNALGAIALCRSLSVPVDAIKAGLESLSPMFGRSQVIRGKVTILQDCYNANPDSMRESVGFVSELDWKGRKVAVLGEMAELGEYSEELHRKLGEWIAGTRLDHLLLYGDGMRPALEAVRHSRFTGTAELATGMDELRTRVAAVVRSGDLVLLKGSRSTGLEAITPELSE